MKLVLWLSISFIVTRICPSYVLGNCTLIEISHGTASFRMRGRNAQYTCEEGFVLHGNHYAQCVNGVWDRPAPSCVAPGCLQIENITNGEVKSLLNGSVVEITCYPDKIRQGETILLCDGQHWSSAMPLCLEPVKVHRCDFESSTLCGWTQDPDDDFDWTHHSGKTPSGRTGPEADHTRGTHNATGHYIFIEASTPRQPGDVARLLSPWYPSDLSNRCFYFWYHMYGPSEMNVGTLNIRVRAGNRNNYTETVTWSMSGNQGEHWNPGQLRIPSCKDQFQLVLEGVRQNSYFSDIAIDDWLISPCTSTTLNIRDPVAQIQRQTTSGEQISTITSSSMTPGSEKFTKELTTSLHSTTEHAETTSSSEAESYFTSTYVINSTSTSEKNTKVSSSKTVENESYASSTIKNLGILNGSVLSGDLLEENLNQTWAENDIDTVGTHSVVSDTETRAEITQVWKETKDKTRELEGTVPETVHTHPFHSPFHTFTLDSIVNLTIGLLVLCVFIVILIIMGFVCWKQQKIYNDKYQELKLFVETHYRAKYVNTGMSSKRCVDCP